MKTPFHRRCMEVARSRWAPDMGLKVAQHFPLSLFAFSPSLSFRFACLIFFLFFQLAGHLVGFILVGRVSEKPFIILELGAQKGRWVMEQAFHGDFQVSVTWFFLAVSPVSLTELCSFWYSLKDLFSLHKLVDKAVPDR